MKKRLFFKWSLLFVLILFVQNGFAQDTPQWDLPESAKARIGKGRATDIALSPDGAQLAVATGIGVWLYNASTGAEIALLTGHTDRVTFVAYSPNGETLVSASSREFLLWDPSNHQQKTTFDYEGGRSIAYSPNGDILAVGQWGAVDLLDAQTGDKKLSLSEDRSGVSFLDFSADGETLATAVEYSQEPTIHLWNTSTGELLQKLEHPTGIRSITLSPDGNTLISGDWDGMTRVWDTDTGENTQTVHMWFETLTYSPNGRNVAATTDKIYLLNASTAQIRQTLTGHTNGIYRTVFSSDGNSLVSASWDGTIRFWDISAGSNRLTIRGHFNFRAITLSPDGETIATTSDSGIYLWNTSNQRLRKVLNSGNRSDGVAYSPDSQTLAIAEWRDGSRIRLVNASTGRTRKTIRYQGRLGNSMVFSPDGNMLALGGWDGTVRLWNTNTGNLRKTLTAHTYGIASIAFSPGGNMLATGSWDGTVRLWNVRTGENQKTFSMQDRISVAFSPDGKVLAIGNWRETRLLNVQSGELKQTLDDGAESLAYSNDGKTLAGGSWRRIQLWNAGTGEIQRVLTGHPEGVAWLAFDPTDDTLVSRGWDETILIWDMNALPELIAEDVTLDGIVDVEDLVAVASSFGESIEEGMYPNPDVNDDGVVNRQDVLKVMAILDGAAGAPSVSSQTLPLLTADTLQYWIDRAKQLNNLDDDFQSGIRVLEELLATLVTETKAMPTQTALLANYPNPFNPETWIPYQLSEPAGVTVHIYAVDGRLIRILSLDHQPAGMYQSKNRAAYWDGKNEFGESVASGVYFYTLTAGDFTATRKMLIMK